MVDLRTSRPTKVDGPPAAQLALFDKRKKTVVATCAIGGWLHIDTIGGNQRATTLDLEYQDQPIRL